VDEMIEEVESAFKRRPHPIEWNPVLEMCCRDKLQEMTNKLVDMKRLQKTLLNPVAISEYVREYGAASEEEDIVTIIVPKAKHGFEVILLALLDY
jgi:hypothetical protein